MLQTVLAAPAICTAPAAELAAPALGAVHVLMAYEAAHTPRSISCCFFQNIALYPSQHGCVHRYCADGD